MILHTPSPGRFPPATDGQCHHGSITFHFPDTSRWSVSSPISLRVDSILCLGLHICLSLLLEIIIRGLLDLSRRLVCTAIWPPLLWGRPSIRKRRPVPSCTVFFAFTTVTCRTTKEERLCSAAGDKLRKVCTVEGERLELGEHRTPAILFCTHGSLGWQRRTVGKEEESPWHT